MNKSCTYHHSGRLMAPLYCASPCPSRVCRTRRFRSRLKIDGPREMSDSTPANEGERFTYQQGSGATHRNESRRDMCHCETATCISGVYRIDGIPVHMNEAW